MSLFLFQNFTSFNTVIDKTQAQVVIPVATSGTSLASRLKFPNFPIIGANFNKNPESIKFALLERTGTKWIRTSINMFPYMRYLHLLAKKQDKLSDSEKATIAYFDEQLASIKNAQNRGYKVVLTMRWYFSDIDNLDASIRIPLPNDPRENLYFASAINVIQQVGLKSQIIVVGNEPTLETHPDDMKINSSGQIPMVQFYHRLAIQVDKELQKNGRNNYKLLVGSFNRLNWGEFQSHEAVKRLFMIANNNSFIDGVDIHAHVANMDAVRDQLKFARKLLPNKMLIVTEFSLVRAFFRKLDVSVCQGVDETDFCTKFDISPLTTTRNFINKTLTSISEEKYTASLWNQFFKSRSYLPDDFLKEAYELFTIYGVTLATYGLVNTTPEESSDYVEEEVTSLPWDFNSIFVPATVQTGQVIRMNKYFFDTYVQLPKE